MPRQTKQRKPAPAPPASEPSPIRPADQRLVHVILILLLTALVAGVFAYTVQVRKPWFGVLGQGEPNNGHHQWLTASTMKFTRNWYRQGAWHLRFLMLENPASVEFPTLESRSIYCSYPPGCLLPIYAIARITHQEPAAGMIMTYNLANHFLIALLLALTVYLLLVRLSLPPINAALFAAIPPLIELLMPAPLYWHQNVYFTDQAVILPFVLLVFLEVFREAEMPRKRRIVLDILQGIVLFSGFFTDWFFVFVGVVLFAKRLLAGEIRLRPFSKAFLPRSLTFWAGPALALGLFAWQLSAFHLWGVLFDRFRLRSSANLSLDGVPNYHVNFFYEFWRGGHIKHGYGVVAIYLLWGSLLALVIIGILVIVQLRRKIVLPPAEARLLFTIGMVLLPCFIQIYCFRNHSYVHDFSALKFSIPLALVPLVLLPAWLLFRLRAIGRRTEIMLAMNLLVLVLAVIYVLRTFHGYKDQFFPTPAPLLNVVGHYFSQFGYNDVLISPDLEIPANPPQLLAYTMKRIYKVSGPADVQKISAAIAAPHRMVLVRLSDIR